MVSIFYSFCLNYMFHLKPKWILKLKVSDSSNWYIQGFSINKIKYIIYNKYHSFSIRQDVIPWLLQYRFKVFRKLSIFVSPLPTGVPQISLSVAYGIGRFDFTLMIPVKRTSLSWNQYIVVKTFWKFGIEFWKNICLFESTLNAWG